MRDMKNLVLSDTFLFFAALILSNIPVLFLPIWLLPQIVFPVAFLWIVFTVFVIYKLMRKNLSTSFLIVLKENWLIFPFVIYSAVSLSWSVAPEISIARWLTLICTIVFCGYIGVQYSLSQISDALAMFGAYLLMLCVAMIISVPDVGIMNYYSIQGAWKGIFWHKNHMGLIATFFNVLFLLKLLISYKRDIKEFVVWCLLYLFSLILIYKTDSVAAYMTLILMHGFIFLALGYLKYKDKLTKSHYLFMLLLLAGFGFVVFINADFVLGLFNRNATLTGRVPMWSHLFDLYLSKRPFLGYGFNGFWHVLSHEVVMGEVAHYPDPIIISDNGFIDMLISGGFIGLFLFAIFYFGIWQRVVKFSFQARSIIDLFPIVLMVYIFLANLTWSLLFENEGLFMLLMVTVLFTISLPKEKGM